MKYFSFFFLALIGVFLLALPITKAAEFSNNDSSSITQPIHDDAFLAGNTVSITAPISGDSFLAGNTVSVDQKIDRSIYAAGNTVTINNGAGYNVFVAGQNITLKGDFGHDVYIAGQTITFDPSTHIHGQLRMSGQTIVIGGTIDGWSTISGSTITTAANFGNSVILDAPTLTFQGGTVAGDLTYRTPKQLTDFGGLTVKGSTKFESQNYITTESVLIRSAIMGVLTMLVSGAALLFFARRKVKNVLEIVTQDWVKSLGIGVATLILVPIIAGLLIIVSVGAPLGLILLGSYLIAIYFGGLIGYILLGVVVFRWLKLKTNDYWLPFIGALIVMGIFQIIPIIGPIIFLAFFLGVFLPTFGALVTWYYRLMVGEA